MWILLKSIREFLHSKTLKTCLGFGTPADLWEALVCLWIFASTCSSRVTLGTMRRKMLGRTTGLRNGIGDFEMQKGHGRHPPSWGLSDIEPKDRAEIRFFFWISPAYMFHGTCQRLALAFHRIPGRASTLPTQLDRKLQGILLFLPPTSTRDFWDYRHTYYHTCLLCEFCRSTLRSSHLLDKHVIHESILPVPAFNF